MTSYALDEPGSDLRAHLAALWRRRLTIVAVTALAVLVALAVSLLQDKTYRAETTLVVVEGASLPRPPARTAASPYTKTLAELLESDQVAVNVIQNLRLDESPRQLLDRVHVAADPETALLEVSVVDENAERARQIAFDVSSVFVQLVQQRFARSAGNGPRLTVQIWDPAHIVGQASPRLWRNLLLALGLGFVLSLLAAAVQESLTRPRTGAELERALGAPIVAEVAPGDQLDALAAALPRLSPSRTPATVLLVGRPAPDLARRLAAALVRGGARPLVVDTTDRTEPGLVGVVVGEVELDETVRSVDGVPTLALGSAADPATVVASSEALALLERLAVSNSHVLVAGPPHLAVAVDVVLVVADRRGLPAEVAARLRGLGVRPTGIVLVGPRPSTAPDAAGPAEPAQPTAVSPEEF